MSLNTFIRKGQQTQLLPKKQSQGKNKQTKIKNLGKGQIIPK